MICCKFPKGLGPCLREVDLLLQTFGIPNPLEFVDYDGNSTMDYKRTPYKFLGCVEEQVGEKGKGHTGELEHSLETSEG